MSFQNTPADENDTVMIFNKILPTYQRDDIHVTQPVNFNSFLHRVDAEVRALKRRLPTLMPDDILVARIQKHINDLEKKKEFYDDKVAYTTQYSNNPPKKICILFHGMGDYPMEMAQHAPKVEDVLFIVPQGFRPFKIMWNVSWNYQWFDIGSMSRPSKDLIRKGVEHNRPIIMEWIDDILEVYNMTYDDLILCGFSQGAVTALDLVNYYPHIKYAIAVAGAMEALPNMDHTGKYILLIHHPIDPMVPYEESEMACDYLRNCHANVTLQQPDTKGHLIFYCHKTQQYMRDFIEAIRG